MYVSWDEYTEDNMSAGRCVQGKICYLGRCVKRTLCQQGDEHRTCQLEDVSRVQYVCWEMCTEYNMRCVQKILFQLGDVYRAQYVSWDECADYNMSAGRCVQSTI
jgi:hypothetical protein